MKKKMLAAVLLTGAIRVVAQDQLPCDGECPPERSAPTTAIGQIKLGTMPRLLQK